MIQNHDRFRSVLMSLLMAMVGCALAGCNTNVPTNAVTKSETAAHVHIEWISCDEYKGLSLDMEKCYCSPDVIELHTIYDGGCAYYKKFQGYVYCLEKNAEDSVFDETVQMYKTTEEHDEGA